MNVQTYPLCLKLGSYFKTEAPEDARVSVAQTDLELSIPSPQLSRNCELLDHEAQE